MQIKSITAKKISKLLILEPFLVNWYDLDIIKVRFLNSWVIITLVYYTRGENQSQYRKELPHCFIIEVNRQNFNA